MLDVNRDGIISKDDLIKSLGSKISYNSLINLNNLCREKKLKKIKKNCLFSFLKQLQRDINLKQINFGKI